uniref:Putative ovule protein n=1 Tax=Solanum chacoense TaxID=4108 RepID=A0A0V0IKD1_SOLCH
MLQLSVKFLHLGFFNFMCLFLFEMCYLYIFNFLLQRFCFLLQSFHYHFYCFNFPFGLLMFSSSMIDESLNISCAEYSIFIVFFNVDTNDMICFYVFCKLQK